MEARPAGCKRRGNTGELIAMKALLQRVSEARVEIAGEVVGAIDRGLVILFCAEPGDQEADAKTLAPIRRG